MEPLMPNSGEDFETVPHLQLMEEMPLSCRPLWLAHHSPLVKESRGGQLLPANRIQVKKKTGARIRQLFLQTVSLPETLNQMPVVFNRKEFFTVILSVVVFQFDYLQTGSLGAFRAPK